MISQRRPQGSATVVLDDETCRIPVEVVRDIDLVSPGRTES